MKPRSCRSLSFEVEVGLPIEQAFEFFSDIGQLNGVTPSWFHLRPLAATPDRLAVGTEIDYRFRWRLFSVRWRTHITDWEPLSYFAYEQERGPYRYFRHEHRFEPSAGGTLVRDDVLYSVVGGAAVGRWLVEPDLRRVFGYRSRIAGSKFPVEADTPPRAVPTLDLPA